MITGQDIVNEAREWIGTPFHHQGRQKGLGVDCVGLVQQIAVKFNLINYDRRDYGREPAKGLLKKELENHLESVDKLSAGVILLMRFGREPQHVAIYTEKNTIIHSYASVGKCVEHRLDDKWKKRIVKMYKIKGVL